MCLIAVIDQLLMIPGDCDVLITQMASKDIGEMINVLLGSSVVKVGLNSVNPNQYNNLCVNLYLKYRNLVRFK